MTALEPSLTAKTLREILKKMGQFDDLPDTPLKEYVLVRQQLDRPENVKDETAVARVVFETIASIITEDFIQLRQQHQRPAPHHELTNADRLAALKLDAASNNNRLMAASSIYYVYLTPELGIDIKDIDRHFPFVDRTMQRRRDDYLEYIRYLIIQREIAARHSFRQTRCLLKFRQETTIPLSSQEQTVRTGLAQLQRARALHLYGAAGIGKSTIALQIAKRFIELMPISDATQIKLPNSPTHPPTATDLFGLICDSLHIGYGQKSTERAFQGFLTTLNAEEAILLVLDDVENWMTAILDAWTLLSQCWIIVTAKARHPAWPGAEGHVQPITQREAKQLIRYLQTHVYHKKKVDEADLDSIAEELFVLQHGNIGQITTAYRYLDDIAPTISVKQRHQPALKTLSTNQQVLLVMVGYISLNAPLTYQLVQEAASQLQLSYPEHLQQDFLALIDTGYLYSETHAAERFYQPTLNIEQVLFDETLRVLNLALADAVLEHQQPLMSFNMLTPPQFWILIDAAKLMRLVRLAHEYVKARNLWQHWLLHLRSLEVQLRDYSDRHVVVLVEKAATLRWMGQFQHAQHDIDDAILLAQHVDHSLLLAEGLLERTRLSIYYGEPTEADAQWAGEIFAEQDDQDGVQGVLFVLAQLWLRIDANSAEHYLSQIPQHSLSHLALLAEIKLAQGHLDEALNIVRRCLRQANHEEVGYGRLLNLLAQILVANRQVDQAYATYENAINHAQLHYDMWGLARLYTNFAALLINEGDIYPAREQLLRAILLYEQLQDHIGQQAAQENLAMLQKLF